MLLRLLKILVSVGLLALLFSQVDYAALRTELYGASWGWFLASLCLVPVTVWIGVRKWQILMADRGLSIGTSRLVRYFVIGHLFGNFMPSNVGGDVVRAGLATRFAGRHYWPIAAGSVLVERLTGLVGLFIALALAVVLHYEWFASLGLNHVVLLAFLGFAAALLVIFSDIGSGMISWTLRVPILRKPALLVQKLHNLVLEYRGSMGVLFRCIGLSVVFYFLNAVMIWLILHVFPPVNVGWTTQLVTYTLTSLIAMIPISFNGYGIQEGGYAVLLGSLGYSFGQALTVGILYRGTSIMISIVGAYFFASSHLSRQAIEEEIEETTLSLRQSGN